MLQSLGRGQSLVENAPHHFCIMPKIKRMSDHETSIMSFSFDDVSPAGTGAKATYTDETNAFWLSTNQ